MYSDEDKTDIEDCIFYIKGADKVDDGANYAIVRNDDEADYWLAEDYHDEVCEFNKEDTDKAVTIVNMHDAGDTDLGMRFQEWLILRSPWSAAFDQDSVEFEGVYVVDEDPFSDYQQDRTYEATFTTSNLDMPSAFLIGAYTASRIPIAYPRRVKEMYAMVDDLGVPETLAYLLTYCCFTRNKEVRLRPTSTWNDCVLDIKKVSGQYLVEFLNASPTFEQLSSWRKSPALNEGVPRECMQLFWEGEGIDMFSLFKFLAITEDKTEIDFFGHKREWVKVDMEKTLPILYKCLEEKGVLL
jgi:hypothetical protein